MVQPTEQECFDVTWQKVGLARALYEARLVLEALFVAHPQVPLANIC